MKYVIAQNPLSNHYEIVASGEGVIHRELWVAAKSSNRNLVLVSAGFVYLNPKRKRWEVSETPALSLNLGPASDDEVLLNLFLSEGLTGLDLLNVLALKTLSVGKK